MDSVNVVDCVYRLSVGSEIIAGKYSLSNDIIFNAERFMIKQDNTRIKDYYTYYPGNYEASYPTLDMAVLYSALLKSKSALIAVNYNNIGAILISPDKIVLYLAEDDYYKQPITRISRVFKNVKNIGTLKAPVYTLTIPQPMLTIDAFEENGRYYTATRYGILQLRDNLWNANPTTKSYIDMFSRKFAKVNIYGVCELDNQVQFIIKEGNVLKSNPVTNYEFV